MTLPWQKTDGHILKRIACTASADKEDNLGILKVIIIT